MENEKINAGAEATLEEQMHELDRMVQRLESSDISLEESFLLYKQGMDLLKQCNDKIDTVEKKMLQISGDGELREF